MSDLSKAPQQEASISPGTAENVVRLRLWPAVAIVLIHLTITTVVMVVASTNMQTLIGLGIAPLGAAVLLMVWWLAFSRAPFRDRLVGPVLFLAAVAWIYYTHKNNGGLLLVVAMPVLTTGIVLLTVLTLPMRWKARRLVLVGWLVGCAALFTAVRVEGIAGDLAPVLSWRWSATSEDILTKDVQVRTEPSRQTANVPAVAGDGDWPGFRGAARNGQATGVTFSTDWATTPPKALWRRPVGPAWSSFCVVGDYAFTQEQRGGEESVVCYRADTGDEVWVNGVAARYESTTGDGPRATPTFDQGKLYTLGATGILLCLDATNGQTLWKRELTADTGAGVPGWGYSNSPLVVKDLVIVCAGGGNGKSLIAYHTATGEPAWTAGNQGSGYSSVQPASLGGVYQVLLGSNFGLQAFAPDTGAMLWEHEWRAKGNPRCVQPLLVGDDSVVLGSPEGTGIRRVSVRQTEGAWTAQERWTTKSMRPYFNDSVYHKGYCFGFDGNRLTCLDAETGERRWSGSRCGGQVLLLTDMDMLLVLAEKGDVMLVRAMPEGPTEVARFKALTGKTWNHPVVAHGRLLVRNAEEAACFALGS